MAELTTAERAASPERLVSRWVEAFNARDLDGMLACLSREVDLHPLRLGGLEACYRGHEGVCRWFAQLQHRRHGHAISLSEVRDLGDGRVFAGGCLSLDGEPNVGPFGSLHLVAGGLIASAHHYITEPDMIEQLGLLR